MEDTVDDILQEAEPVPDLATCSHPKLELETDVGLVTYMAFADAAEDKNLAMMACDQLHSRHARFLLAWCIKNRHETFGESAEGFVNKTFYRAYTGAASFVCTDEAKGKEQVLAWLFRIMKNLYLDSLRAEGRRPAVRCTDEEAKRLEEIEELRQEEAEQVPTGVKAAMRAYLETLPRKDQEILISTAEFWDPKKGEAAMADDVRKGICDVYGLTESSLRVRRKRLKERAQVFIQEYIK